MPAYAFDTQPELTSQLSGANIDPVTAAQIANFLATNGLFPTPASTVKVEGPTDGANPLYFTGADATTGVNVYEINGTENLNFSTGQPTGVVIPGYLELNSVGDTLPSATAIVMTYAGADTINVDDNVTNSYLLATGSGNNLVNMHNSTGNDTILTGAGNDSIFLGAGHETVYSGGGSDEIVASAGTNQIYGYSSVPSDGGNDLFYVTGGTNTISTSDGSNTIDVFGGNNVVTTGAGNDTINGYAAGISQPGDTSVFNLGSGNDTVTTGPGSGTINGGAGEDSILLVNGGSWQVNLDTAASAAQPYDPSQPLTYNDVIQDYSGTNTITGGAANTLFNINGGNSSITGGSGTDQFNVNTSAAQTLVGGSHYDLFNVNGASGAGADTITGGTGYTYVNVNLTQGSISIDGSASSGNTVDFTQFASTDATISHNNITGSDTYTFGTGPNALTAVIADPSNTTVKFH